MWKLIILILSVVWALKASEDIGIQKKKHTYSGCNSTLYNSTNGGFALDKHNVTEPCFWNITYTKSPAPVNLFFSEITLHEGDNLTIFKSWEDAISNNNSLNEKPIISQNGTLTIITEEKYIVLKLEFMNVAFDRNLDGFYSVNACSVAVGPDVTMLHQPMYIGNISTPVDCEYRFNEIAHKRAKQVFSFTEFNMSSSSVKVEGGTFSGDYQSNPPTDFFIDLPSKNVLTLTVTQAVNSTDYFSLKIHEVDSACSGRFTPAEHIELSSPVNEMNNGSIISECRWLITSSPGSIAGLKFDTLDFKSVFDIVAINDGLSEFSNPLLQVTTSNRNKSQTEIIRASGSGLWVSFKPLSYESRFIATASKNGQGGYHKGDGNIEIKSPADDDTVFLLEVDAGKIVELDVQVSTLVSPATISIYDGFDMSYLLTSISSQINFPILSRSSKMMISSAKFSGTSKFQALFKGVVPGCNHMSSVDSENYLLSENCNSTCKWIIPPQNPANSITVIDLQFISLQVGDSIKIQKLDSSLTVLGQIDASVTHVPQIIVPSNIGALITVTQGVCKEKKDRIVLIGHASFVPSCNEAITLKASESYQISSPMYPDTYPVFASCHWNISVPKEAIVHIAFQTFNLANNHCLKISQNGGKPIKYEGKTLPSNDLFLPGDVQIEFDSSGCDKPVVGNALSSDLGFLFNVTVADCGAILEGKNSGNFNISISGNNSICLWKVVVPPAGGDSVNIISFLISEKMPLQNYSLTIYDGATVRDSKITNVTANATIWSRTDTLIFVYRRMNVSSTSPVLPIKFETISCNKTMQCDNKICMHPDWRCNGENECGDFTDERNCGGAPLPPPTPPPPSPSHNTGYSSTTLGLSIFFMLILGAVLGLSVPVCYRKYRDSQYRRFHDLDG